MTYRELRATLSDLTEEQLDCDVTVEAVMSEEFIAASEIRIVGVESGIMDEDHPVISVGW